MVSLRASEATVGAALRFEKIREGSDRETDTIFNIAKKKGIALFFHLSVEHSDRLRLSQVVRVSSLKLLKQNSR